MPVPKNPTPNKQKSDQDTAPCNRILVPLTIANLITIARNNKTSLLVIISHYAPSNNSTNAREELIFFATNIKRLHLRIMMTVMGDLNINHEQATALANTLNFKFANQL